MIPRLTTGSASMSKKRATPAILRAYFDNRSRLAMELAKIPRDRYVENNIKAYYHILKSLEENYAICECGAATPILLTA